MTGATVLTNHEESELSEVPGLSLSGTSNATTCPGFQKKIAPSGILGCELMTPSQSQLIMQEIFKCISQQTLSRERAKPHNPLPVGQLKPTSQVKPVRRSRFRPAVPILDEPT